MSYVLVCVSFSLGVGVMDLFAVISTYSLLFPGLTKLHKGLGDSGSDTVQHPLNYGSHRAGNARLMGVSGPALWHGDVRLL